MIELLVRLDELLGKPQVCLHKRLITVIFGAFLMPYVWLSVVLGMTGCSGLCRSCGIWNGVTVTNGYREGGRRGKLGGS